MIVNQPTWRAQTTTSFHQTVANGTFVAVNPQVSTVGLITIEGEATTNVTWNAGMSISGTFYGGISAASGASIINIAVNTASWNGAINNLGTASGFYGYNLISFPL
jgi:hypothetical protein